MRLETKFGNGDSVWNIKQEMRYEWHVCSFCGGGKGIIVGANNEEAFCPRCHGKGGRNEQKIFFRVQNLFMKITSSCLLLDREVCSRI